MKPLERDSGIIYLLFLFIITPLLFTLFIPGCYQAPSKTEPDSASFPLQTLTTAPTGPISAYFTISESPLLGKPVELTLTFTVWERPAPDAPDTTARIILPEGFELVSGDLEWDGLVSRGETYKVTATIRSIKTGDWVIGGSIRYSESKGGNLVGTECNMSVSVFEDAVIVKGRGIREDIRTDIFLSNPPELGKPVTLTFAFAIKEEYKQDAPDTTARIVLPEGFELIDGDLQWEGDLTRDTIVQIKATIKAVKTGDWRIRAVAWFSPSGGISLGGSDVLSIEYYEDGTFNIGGSGDPFQPWWQPIPPEPRLEPILSDDLSITIGEDSRFNDPVTITGDVTSYFSENNLLSSGTPRDDVDVSSVDFA